MAIEYSVKTAPEISVSAVLTGWGSSNEVIRAQDFSNSFKSDSCLFRVGTLLGTRNVAYSETAKFWTDMRAPFPAILEFLDGNQKLANPNMTTSKITSSDVNPANVNAFNELFPNGIYCRLRCFGDFANKAYDYYGVGSNYSADKVTHSEKTEWDYEDVIGYSYKWSGIALLNGKSGEFNVNPDENPAPLYLQKSFCEFFGLEDRYGNNFSFSTNGITTYIARFIIGSSLSNSSVDDLYKVGTTTSLSGEKLYLTSNMVSWRKSNLKIYAVDWLNFMLSAYNSGEPYFRENVPDYFDNAPVITTKTDWSFGYTPKVSPRISITSVSELFDRYPNKDVAIWGTRGDKSQVTHEQIAINLTASEPFETSFLEIMKILDVETANRIEESTQPETLEDIPDITIVMQNRYDKDLSSYCYVTISFQGEILDYGPFYPDFNDGSNVSTYVIDGTGDTPSDKKINDTYTTPDEASEPVIQTTPISAVSIGTKTYRLRDDEQGLNNMMQYIWSNNWVTGIDKVNVNPIENVVSIKCLPFINQSDNTPLAFHIGNVYSGTVGFRVSDNYIMDLGEIDIPRFYNNFFDYSPYTNITIFLPFIGYHTLDTSICMGRKVKVKYLFDTVTGQCQAQIFVNDVPYQSFDGIAGIDIPITSNNRAQLEYGKVMSGIGSALTIASAAGAASVGNFSAIPTAVASVASNTLQAAAAPYKIEQQGKYGADIGFLQNRTCFIIIDRPIVQIPTSYAHDNGRPCELSRYISSISGYTETSVDVDLSGFECTENEKEEIIRILSSGFYA